MNRIPRTMAIAVLSCSLFAALPAAHARALENPPSSQPALAGNWLNATLAWIGNLLVGTPSAQPARSSDKLILNPPPGGIAAPMTGSCIDPNGCLFGGPGGL